MYEHIGRLPLKLWDVTLVRPENYYGKTITYEGIQASDEIGAIAVVQDRFESTQGNGKVKPTARWTVKRSK